MSLDTANVPWDLQELTLGEGHFHTHVPLCHLLERCRKGEPLQERSGVTVSYQRGPAGHSRSTPGCQRYSTQPRTLLGVVVFGLFFNQTQLQEVAEQTEPENDCAAHQVFYFPTLLRSRVSSICHTTNT